MEFIIQIIINSLTLGLYYALISVGFTMVLSIARIFNFAHCEFYMLGGYFGYYFIEQFGVNYFPAIILTTIATALFGWVIEKVLFHAIRGELYASFMVSLGLTLVLPASAMIVFGERMKSIQTIFHGVVNIFGALISWERIVIIFACGVIILLLTLFLQRTKMGRAFRAMAQDREAASLQGVDCDRGSTLAFSIAAGLGGVASIIVLPAFYISPFIGGPATLKAMVVVILGGLGSIPGAMVGGITLGFIEGISMTFIGELANMIGWIVIMILILFRPLGLMGKEWE
jgi:branched-chain amino acid transport system permease protein